jgi:hypothetical protein
MIVIGFYMYVVVSGSGEQNREGILGWIYDTVSLEF